MSRLPGKRARPVLRGPRRGNAPGLPDEVYFSVIQRKLLTPDDFEDLDDLATQILAFEKHYNAAARPFDWKFTRTSTASWQASGSTTGTHRTCWPHDDELTGATTRAITEGDRIREAGRELTPPDYALVTLGHLDRGGR